VMGSRGLKNEACGAMGVHTPKVTHRFSGALLSR
jgi:hypothetical protein